MKTTCFDVRGIVITGGNWGGWLSLRSRLMDEIGKSWNFMSDFVGFLKTSSILVD